MNQQIKQLQGLSQQQHPRVDQEGEHNKNVVFLLQNKLGDVSAHFKDVLEVRTKNLQASRSRTENFVSSVSQHAQPALQQSASPLYGTPNRGTPSPGADLLSLHPVGDQQLLQMEEAQPQNTYIQQRGEAIEAIEKTIGELGSIFGQLATMVSEQSEMIQRIDAVCVANIIFHGRRAVVAHANRFRLEHRRRRRQRRGCAKRAAQVLVESQLEPHVDRKDVRRADDLLFVSTPIPPRPMHVLDWLLI